MNYVNNFESKSIVFNAKDSLGCHSSAKTESIEARLSLSNLCDEESFLCDELEERVDVSRRVAIANGQSLFAEINTIVIPNFYLFDQISIFFRLG